MEPPLGLIALLSYLNRELEEKIEGKIIKSKIDFDSYEELTKVIDEFDPDIIGVSAMTFHKNFFHDAIRNIRKHGYKKMIIVGGPHPTTSFKEVLEDKKGLNTKDWKNTGISSSDNAKVSEGILGRF